VIALASSFVTKLEDCSLVDQPDEEAVRQGVDAVEPHPMVYWLELPHPDNLLLLTLVTALTSSFVTKLEDRSLVNQPDEEAVRQGVEVVVVLWYAG